MDDSKKLIKYLKYKSEILSAEFSNSWTELLKNSGVNFYTSRKDTLWFSMRGKGFTIWIHGFYPGRDESWYAELEIMKSAPKPGMEIFEEFIECAVQKLGVTVISLEEKKLLDT